MNNKDFSNGFDNLLNSYAHSGRFGEDVSTIDLRVDEYEKSQFLAYAQEDIVLSLYTGRNSSTLGFEETEELRRYLSNLVEDAELSPTTTSNGKPLGVDSNSKFFTLPDNLWFITYESVLISNGKCGNDTTMEVVPVRQDEYHRLKNNPFRGANDRRSLRLDLSDGMVEIVSKYNVTSYYVRYLKKIKPIVLTDLREDGLTINGVSEATECELHESLHHRILERAVEMAIRSRVGGRTTQSSQE